MLLHPDRIDARRPWGLLLSLLTHGVLCGVAVLFMIAFNRVRPIYHQSRCCTAALSWSGETGSGRLLPDPVNHLRKPRISAPSLLLPVDHPILPLRTRRTPQLPPPARSVRSVFDAVPQPQQATMIGTGTGTESAEPAFPVYYPTPVVSDRSLLPVVERKVIVNVTISAQGDVTDEKLVEGIGNGLDALVLATVKSWRFQPATLNGTATASVEELVFPFNRDYPNDGAPG